MRGREPTAVWPPTFIALSSSRSVWLLRMRKSCRRATVHSPLSTVITRLSFWIHSGSGSDSTSGSTV